MKVIIAGGGDVGKEVADDLARHESNEIVVIEINRERAEVIAEELDALVLHGDATDPDMLRKAGGESADALVAATGSDALNTVIAMLGHLFRVEKTIVVLNEMGLRSACREIGVTRIVAPKLAATANIVTSLYGSDLLDLSILGRGGLRLEELRLEMAPKARVSTLAVPEGALLVAIQRGEELFLPKGSLRLREGDVLFVLVEKEEALRSLKATLGQEDGSA
jgi:trk system potassium uptake protein TrkA